jgi:hypothetical protein
MDFEEEKLLETNKIKRMQIFGNKRLEREITTMILKTLDQMGLQGSA